MAETLPDNATVVRVEPLVDCLYRIFVRPDWSIASTPWKPGQFVRLAITSPGGDTKKEARAYSFAGVHPERNELEFYVVEVADGVQTPRLRRAAAGSRLWCEHKVQGHFTIENNAPGLADVWLVGTGAGLAPFLPMVRSGVLDRYERAVVVHQVREVGHLAYGDVLRDWARADSRRRYVPIVSKPSSRFVVAWGHAPLFGHVGDLLTSGQLERAAETTFAAERSAVMLCGNPKMITDVRERLEARGLVKHLKRTPGNMVAERYW